MMVSVADKILIEAVHVAAYVIPTTTPESDGTLEWDSTTLVLVEIKAGGKTGTGYTYGDTSVAHFIYNRLRPLVTQQNVMHIPFLWDKMVKAVRNEGACGMAMMAVSAVDAALWDAKARIMEVPLSVLLGQVRESVNVYGSGGFTSYSINQLRIHMDDWAGKGFSSVKIKIGRDRDEDLIRVKAARESVGEHAALFVDANGAYDIKTALRQARLFADCGVTWLEEPVPSADLEGLAFIRDHSPCGIRIAAGEYINTLPGFVRMIQARAVDVLQADATRCGGITGFLKAGALAEAMQIPFSFHCAPSLHLHAAAALPAFYIGEYFYDHARIEEMLFEGAPVPVSGKMSPDLSSPGTGIAFRHQDAEAYKV